MEIDKVDISLIVPSYNEEESLPELVDWVAKVMDSNRFSYEIVIIDDGSSDDSWSVIEKLSLKNPYIYGIRFNRNYGKSAALNEGFRACNGEVVITMDADLQDSPNEVPGLYKMITEDGYDVVSGWKKKRYDPISKTIPSKLYNAFARLLSGIKLHDFNCGLKAYKNRVVKNIEVYGEMHRYIPFMAKSIGFNKIGEKVVEHKARKYGVTKFGLERFIFGFLDLLTISFVSRFKKRPMHFFGSFGTLSFLFGTSVTFYLIVEKVWGVKHGLDVREIVDQPLFYLALVAIILGTQMFLAGFLGELVMLNNTKKNDYLISEEIKSSKREILLAGY